MNSDIKTVAQLIEILKTFPADLPVLVSGHDSGYDCFYYPEIVDMVHKSENMDCDGEYQFPETGETAEFSAVVLARTRRYD